MKLLLISRMGKIETKLIEIAENLTNQADVLNIT